MSDNSVYLQYTKIEKGIPVAKTITLKFAGKCADTQCGATLPVGSKGRWYGRGRIYGMDCHDKFDGGVRWVNGRAIQANGA